MSNLAACNTDLYWRGCYRGRYDLLVPEAYSHPAKMAPGLCYHIFEHLKELGWLKEGDVILDFLAGTGMTGLVAATLGFPSILVELEPYFKDLIGDCHCQGVTEQLFRRMMKGSYNRTRKLSYINTRICPACQTAVDKRRGKNERTIFRSEAHYYDGNRGNLKKKFLNLNTQIIQGDSRNLSELLKERGLIAVTSPPYSDSQIDYKHGLKELSKNLKGRKVWEQRFNGNPDNPDNIGNLKDRPLKAVVSPPYAEAQTGGGIVKEGYRGPHINEMGKNQPDKVGERCGYTQDAQGQTEGQIANLPDRPLKAITSPPYEDSLESGSRHGNSGIAKRDPKIGNVGRYNANSDGQIGNLKAITSPPYANRVDDYGLDKDGKKGYGYKRDSYGRSEGQIGIPVWDSGREEDYLSAMLKCYTEAAKVCDVLIVVTKNPTRDHKLRHLDLDTIAILQKAGWDIHCQHRSLLFEEVETTDMFGEYKKKLKGRISFFKLLSYKKGAEVAMWEDCFFCRRKQG